MRLRVISTSPSGDTDEMWFLAWSLGQRLLQRLQHLLAVLFLLHVDEVDDDDAAEVAQPQLARDRHRRLEIGAEDRLLERAVADVRAGVDVDRRHRFGLVEDQVAAGLERHLAVERLLDLLLDAVQVEDRPVAVVQLDALGHVGHERARELQHALVRLRMVDAHLVHAARHYVAHHAHRQRQILVHEIAGPRGRRLLAQHRPELLQEHHVGSQCIGRRAFCSSTHDVAAGFIGCAGTAFAASRSRCRSASSSMRAEMPTPRPFGMYTRYRDGIVMNVVSRAPFVPSGSLSTCTRISPPSLTSDWMSAVRRFVDRLVELAVLADRGMHDVRSVQERRALQADVDERGLHARQHARHAALVDIADQPAAVGALEEDLLQHAVLDQRGAHFARADVDQDLAVIALRLRSSASSSPVSNSGSPMIPE